MARLLIHVEGQTEETFVREVLEPYLRNRNYVNVRARLIGNSRQRNHRGGIRSWSLVRKDILNHLKQDRECLVTTMVDYYALPNNWPGRQNASSLPFPENVEFVENALKEDVCVQLGDSFDPRYFIPFVMMHEFEALLFSDCQSFGKGISRPDLVPEFQAIRNEFSTPEEINDSPITAPSRRIKDLMPDYEKPLFGTLAILEIGLDAIRRECKHFREWLELLEAWS